MFQLRFFIDSLYVVFKYNTGGLYVEFAGYRL